MVMSGQVLESCTACLRVFFGGHENIGGLVAIGFRHHGRATTPLIDIADDELLLINY